MMKKVTKEEKFKYSTFILFRIEYHDGTYEWVHENSHISINKEWEKEYEKEYQKIFKTTQ